MSSYIHNLSWKSIWQEVITISTIIHNGLASVSLGFFSLPVYCYVQNTSKCIMREPVASTHNFLFFSFSLMYSACAWNFRVTEHYLLSSSPLSKIFLTEKYWKYILDTTATISRMVSKTVFLQWNIIRAALPNINQRLSYFTEVFAMETTIYCVSRVAQIFQN